MPKSEMDEFNERDVNEPFNKETKVTWDENSFGQEAVCAVCDSLFTASVDRPPIFCPTCKQGLAEVLQL